VPKVKRLKAKLKSPQRSRERKGLREKDKAKG
jgi:hypothetical protein